MDPVVRTILHVDLDAFFAAVEVREDPDLRGKPVVVGADPRGGRGRGVVAAASYEAREYGIRSAMPISQAYRRCPDAVFRRPRMSLYAAVSRQFMAILQRYTDLVEPLSIDEAFLDITGSAALFGDGETIARRIKEDVKREQRLTSSIGLAPTKFVAKIASDLRKPDGLVIVNPDGVASFLADLPIERLWGAGRKAVARFERLGVRTIGEVATLPIKRLERQFGQSLARHFHELARGIDPREVVPDYERKSIGRETTFLEDVQDRRRVEQALLTLVEDVTQRLRKHGVLADTITVKLRTADFLTVTRQARVSVPADTTDTLLPVAHRLLAKADFTGLPIRLVGVSASIASPVRQLGLFDTAMAEKQRRLARAIDAVTERFGDGAIRRAAAISDRRPSQRRLRES